MHHDTSLIDIIAVGLALAFILGTLAHRLKLSPLVGYLMAGICVGPFTPGFVADQALATQLSELGVMLLMFGVGLHFSLEDLMEVKWIAIPGALAQIAAATLLGWGLAWSMGWPTLHGLVFGLALSVASTVVLLRAMEERRLLETLRGRIAVGWLIVEDLVMVLALVLLPALADALGGKGADTGSILGALGVTLLKMAAFVAVMLVVGRRAIPWALEKVAATGSRELFTLSVLAIALGVAFGSATLFGVSFALGAFFAGMLLKESELSHKAANDSLPLRDAFAVLFFVSVGMLFDPHILLEHPWQVLATFLTITVGKSLAAFVIVRAFGHPTGIALTISTSLAQIGEFSFILAGLGVSLAILPETGRDLILAGALLSIIANPLLFTWLDRWQARQAVEAPVTVEPELPPGPSLDLVDHAIVIGYGRVGSCAGGRTARARRAGAGDRRQPRPRRTRACRRHPRHPRQRRRRPRAGRGASGKGQDRDPGDPAAAGGRRGPGQAACAESGADPAGAGAQRCRGQASARPWRRRHGDGRARAGVFAGGNGDGDAAVPGDARRRTLRP